MVSPRDLVMTQAPLPSCSDQPHLCCLLFSTAVITLHQLARPELSELCSVHKALTAVCSSLEVCGGEPCAGSTKRYKSVERIYKLNDRVVVAASGELSDFQFIITLLDELTSDDFRADDGITMGPEEVYAYLQVMAGIVNPDGLGKAGSHGSSDERPYKP